MNVSSLAELQQRVKEVCVTARPPPGCSETTIEGQRGPHLSAEYLRLGSNGNPARGVIHSASTAFRSLLGSGPFVLSRACAVFDGDKRHGAR